MKMKKAKKQRKNSFKYVYDWIIDRDADIQYYVSSRISN